MRREGKDAPDLIEWVTNLPDAINARTHLERERVIRRVISPLLWIIVLTLLSLIVCDAIGLIKPMRDSLLKLIGVVLGTTVLGSTLSAGFSWLFPKKVS